MKTIKFKKGRVPRKLKKEWKKDPYFCIFGRIWINEYKWNVAQIDIKDFYNVSPA